MIFPDVLHQEHNLERINAIPDPGITIFLISNEQIIEKIDYVV
jgi:hypothetical protein